MLTMTTGDPILSHPEYARAYHHYLHHGSDSEDAARRAYEHTRQHLAKPQSFAKRKPGLLALIIVGVVATLFGAIFAVDAFTDDAPAGDRDRSGGARRACQDFVRDRLKAPASADFSGPFSTDITRSGDRYTVDGTVDAENSFGAKLRYQYHCEVSLSGDQWTLVDIKLSD